MSYREEVEGIAWPEGRILPTFQRPEKLLVCEMRGASRDIQLSVSTLTGLLNRPQPRVYLIGSDDDAFWLSEALSIMPQVMASFRNDDALSGLLGIFHERVPGMVVYNPQCIDSINIATMMAAQRDGFVVAPGQVQDLAVRYDLPVLADVRDYGWKSRVEVYEWARQHLLENTSGRLVAGLDPRNVTNLRSFLVAARIFMYHLDTRQFLPGWGNGRRSERGQARDIFKAFPPGGAHLGWFIDEPSGVDLASQAALLVLATDHFSNLEVWTSVLATATQPAHLLPQGAINRAPTDLVGETNVLATDVVTGASPKTSGYSDDQSVRAPFMAPTGPGGANPSTFTPHASVGAPFMAPTEPGGANPSTITPNPSIVYVSFMMSEGDNLQYNQKRMRRMWSDAARGSVPIGWTFSPLLPEAAPAMAEYYARTATSNDEFVAGPSGAGYMYPSRWPKEHLASFLELTGRRMREMGLTTLEALDTNLHLRIRLPYLFNLGYGMGFRKRRVQRRFAQALAPYGVRGIFSGAWTLWPRWAADRGGMPVCQNLGQAMSVRAAVRMIRAATALKRQRPLFLNLYVLAWNMTPTDLKKVAELLGDGYEVVTPGTLLALLAQSKVR